MTHPYRSGLRFSPPLGLGGHGFEQIVKGDGHMEKHGRARVWVPDRESLSVYRCTSCFVIVPGWAVREGFYSQCRGSVRALEAVVSWEGLSPPYSTIVADPPWHYDARPIGGPTPGSMGKQQSFPYSTMSIDEIRALPIGDLAAPDCALWLWTTNRWLPESFSVLETWGFAYKQTVVWGKNNPMPVGSVAPSAAEFLLVAKRGAPEMKWVWPSSVLVTARPMARQHSVKPQCFGDYIEASSPGPYVELFARQPRLGWDSWGHGYEGVA